MIKVKTTATLFFALKLKHGKKSNEILYKIKFLQFWLLVASATVEFTLVTT